MSQGTKLAYGAKKRLRSQHKIISISTRGIAALKKHAKQKNHRDNV